MFSSSAFSNSTVEFLGFQVKLLGVKSRKNVLISAGNLADKEKMLPSIKKLAAANINIYCTEGTHHFLEKHGVPNTKIYKIAEKTEPNIKSFLSADRFDLIINVLVGNHDYDEASDSNLIRSMSIQNGIPLLTDLNVVIMTIEQMLERMQEPVKRDAWDLKSEFFQLLQAAGGFTCHHAHFDKAYLISPENLKLGQIDMQKKWALYKFLKENYTEEDLYNRIKRGLDSMIAQGCSYVRSMVDGDSTIKTLAVDVALKVKAEYKNRIKFDIGIQPLEGVLEPEARKWFTACCEKADFIGGLPSKDRPTPEKHLDYILQLAKDLNKPIDVHVDQENNPDEHETELLALKTIEFGLEGRVNAIHSVSLAAQTETEQDRVIKIVKDAGVGVIVCPMAAISMKMLPKQAPLHNAIAPVPKLLEAEVPVYLGADNIYDFFMPFADGDLWVECRAMMEACRHYKLEDIVKVASMKWQGNT